MTIADGSRHNLRYIKETTFGTTPTGSQSSKIAMKPLRHTGTSLSLSKEQIESEEIRDDRQIAHHRHGNRAIGGDVNFELSHSTFDDFLEAALCGTWAANVVKAGLARRSFTIERHHSDINKYLRYTGCNIATMSLSVAPNSMVTGSFGVVGKGFSTGTAALTHSTNGTPTATEPFDSFTGTIKEGGSPIATITAIEFNLENGMEAQYVVGSPETLEPSIGQSKVTGSVTAYFTDTTMLDKFVNETESSIEFTLRDAAGNSYLFSFPKVKYNSGDPEVGGTGSITQTLEFVALYDSTAQTQFKITRS